MLLQKRKKGIMLAADIQTPKSTIVKKGGFAYYTYFTPYMKDNGKVSFHQSTNTRKIKGRVRTQKTLTREKKSRIVEIKKVIASASDCFSLEDLERVYNYLNNTPRGLMKIIQPDEAKEEPLVLAG
jgi:hypothetical protein